MTADAGAGSTAAPTCPRHPSTVAYVRCQRCERPTCPACQRPAAVGILCVDCVNEARKQQRPLKSRLGFTAAAGPPYVTYTLIALNVAVFLVAPALFAGSWAQALGLWPDFIPELGVVVPDAGDEWWRWLTAGFVHFGILHLGMNMYVLFQFGSMLEPALGRARYVALYAGSLLGSSAMVWLLGDLGSVHGGASGAIFGLLAAYGIVLRKLKLPYQSLATLAGIWLVAGFFVPGLSWEGHLGGAIAGAIIMVAMLGTVNRVRT
ncbi:MAG: rhomboid family intramembrane serine protease [Actinobacteria bacterium HGW-Actinobacteria-4]|nr:MAG: rhomboid family intramembrane serine protease [Actinobacteria bacterium HGW-Actinobacteria-4]